MYRRLLRCRSTLFCFASSGIVFSMLLLLLDFHGISRNRLLVFNTHNESAQLDVAHVHGALRSRSEVLETRTHSKFCEEFSVRVSSTSENEGFDLMSNWESSRLKLLATQAPCFWAVAFHPDLGVPGIEICCKSKANLSELIYIPKVQPCLVQSRIRTSIRLFLRAFINTDGGELSKSTSSCWQSDTQLALPCAQMMRWPCASLHGRPRLQDSHIRSFLHLWPLCR
jgi:hypothetical protein